MLVLEVIGRPLFVARPLLNLNALNRWAAKQGFTSTLGHDTHVTIAFSQQPVDWQQFTPLRNQITIRGGPRRIQRLGDKGAIVLMFASQSLRQRWQQFRDGGASWDFDDYRPHVTISYHGGNLDPAQMQPYTDDLIFGPEQFKVANADWASEIAEIDL